MSDTPKPYTEEELEIIRKDCEPRRHYCGAEFCPSGECHTCYPEWIGHYCGIESPVIEGASRLLATIADRDRKLTIAEKALRELSNICPCGCGCGEDGAQAALAEIEKLTTPKS